MRLKLFTTGGKIIIRQLLLAFFLIVSTGSLFAQNIFKVTKATDPDPTVYLYDNDDGLCDTAMYGTLQWAIRKANDAISPSTIVFDLPVTSPIMLNHYLPVITKPVVIDGTLAGTGKVVIKGDNLVANYAVANYVLAFNNAAGYGSAIKNVRIENPVGSAFYILSQSGLEISGNEIFGGPAAYTGLLLYGFSNNITVINNHFNGGVASSFGEYAIAVETGGYYYYGGANYFAPNNILIKDNRIENYSLGIFFAGYYYDYANNNYYSSHVRMTNNIINHTYGAMSINPPVGTGIVSYASPEQDLLTPYLAPVIKQYAGGVVSGTAQPYDIIEIFGASAIGESDVYLTSTVADANGNWAAHVGIISSSYLSATATQDPNSMAFGDQPATSTYYSVCAFAPQISSNVSVCEGSNVTLGTTTTAATYSWAGPNGFTSDQQSFTIPNAPAAASGTYTLTVPNAAGCTSAISVVDVLVKQFTDGVFKVNGINHPGDGFAPVCIGTTVNLSTDYVPGATYDWQFKGSGFSFSSNLQNPILPNIPSNATGLYQLIVSAPACTINDVYIRVDQMMPTPTVTSNSPLCLGDMLSLSATYTEAYYAWSGPNGFHPAPAFTPTITIPNVTAATAGTYTLVLLNNQIPSHATCASPPVTTNVVIFSPTSITATATNSEPGCAGGTIQLHAATLYGASYSWTGPGSFSSTLQEPTINYASAMNAGTYSLVVSRCGSTASTTVDVSVGSLVSTFSITTQPISCKAFRITYTGQTMPYGAQWAFGDGTFSDPITDGSTTILHNYPTKGRYTITLSGAESGPCPVVGEVEVTDFVLADFAYRPLNYCHSSAGLRVDITNYNAAYTYQWEVNGNVQPGTGVTQILTAGLLDVKNIIRLIITDPATGCFTDVTKVIKIGAPAATFTANTNLCINQLLTVGSVQPDGDSYTWTLTDPTNATTIQNGTSPYYVLNMAGTYTLTLQTQNNYTNASGNAVICSNTSAPHIINVNAQPQAKLTAISGVCSGEVTFNLGENPSISVSAYSLDFGDGTPVQTGTSYPSQVIHQYTNNGLYTTTFGITNGACNASSSTHVNINQNTNVVINPVQANLCGTGGSVELSPYFINLANDAGMITYTWTGPNGFTSASDRITVNTPGTYTLHVVGPEGRCPFDLIRKRTVVPLAQPTASVLSTTDVQCDGTLGTATIQIPVGLVQQGYWVNSAFTDKNPSATSPATVALNSLNAGDNYITIRNGIDNSCNSQVKVHINQNVPAINLSTTQPTACTGSGSTGAAHASPSAPQTGSNTVKWYSAASYPASPTTANSISGLPVGSYVVELTNGSCKVTENFNIASPVISLSMKKNNLGTCPGHSVTAEVIAQSALSGSYSYAWKQKDANNNYQPISGTTSINTLPIGDYQVDVSVPGSGCSSTIYFKVKELLPLVASFAVTLPDCKNEGQLTPAVAGGDGNYEYAWTLGSTNYSVTTIPILSLAGVTSSSTASLAVNDHSGCSTTYPATGSSAINITIAAPVTIVACGNGNAGTNNMIFKDNCYIGACVQGGVAPYNFQWYVLGNQTRNVTHFFTVDQNGMLTDANGNTITPPTDLADLNNKKLVNTDSLENTSYYPYWNIPLSGNATPILQSTMAGPGDPYSVTELVIEKGKELYVAGNSGGATGALTPNGAFKTGSYKLKVTDARGCTTTMDIGTLNFDEVISSTIAFSYVWGGNPVKTELPDPDPVYPVVAQAMAEAADEMQEAADKCFQQQAAGLSSSVKTNCSDLSQLQDQFSISYSLKEHHHTLYYYDRAGQLTKTVPPEGVEYLTAAQIIPLKIYRTSNTGTPSPFVPPHRMVTTYQYNSMQQLVSQTTPDGGTTNFIYDGKSRLRFSQNAQQAIAGTYSYTNYDELGRIIEVGESSEPGLVFVNPSAADKATNLENADTDQYVDQFPFDMTIKDQVTKTVYTDAAPSINYYGKQQRNLQNRVSYTYIDNDPNTTGDEYYTYYSYDAHGNVEWLVQQDPELGNNYMAYEYDLVSGKVLKVRYNENRADKYFHRYSYDAENRITNVETSRDGDLWDNDASYQYYAHGPLERTVVGEDHIQGLDNIYTIQGWLKSINTPHLNASDDPGNDGVNAASNTNVARDCFGMALNYYKGDYTRTGSFLQAMAITSTDAPDLFNGNISSWVQSQLDNAFNPMNARAELFKYDALNRIKQSTDLEQNSPTTWAALSTGANTFKTTYDYDANGNILDLNRYDQSGAAMDKLSYTYDNGAQGTALHKNRLSSVTDDPGIAGVNGRGDLEGIHTYTYDSIGNLITDVSQERLDVGSGYQLYTVQTNITWTVYGKINDIQKTIQGTSKAETIRFLYDASGNRTQKQVTGNIRPEQTTFYVRDAQGNTMAVYTKGEDPTTPGQTQPTYSYSLIEQPIYGSARIGENKVRIPLSTANSMADLKPPGDGLNAISEYQNWITSSNKAELLPGGTNQLCQCKINTIQGANYDQTGTATEFLGIAENGVAMAEDLDRNMQFYAILVKKYLGNDNACLVYDKNGQLMKGTEQIGAIEPDSKPIIVNITGSNKYALITLNNLHQPVYHIVDMDKKGYGTSDPAGEVVQVNLPMTNYSGSVVPRHGWHFTAYEDHLNNKTIVYTTRYTANAIEPYRGSTQIVAYDFGNNFNAQPVEHLIYQIEGCGITESGELQISPKGDKLLWYQHDERVSGFDYRLADVYTINLSSDKLSMKDIPVYTSTTPGGNYGKGSAEFMKNNDDILFSQRGLYTEATGYDKNVWNYTKVTGQITAINPFTNPDITYLFTEIKRGVDGNYYMPNMGEPAEKIHSYSGAGFNSPEKMLNTPPSDYQLASSLPTQVYKLFASANTSTAAQGRAIGNKAYELNDHLGNVRANISDIKKAVDTDNNGTMDYFEADRDHMSATDYYAFGMAMPGRTFNSSDYRYGFNGKENDNEVKGNGNQQDYGARVYDPRLGKFLSVDPLTRTYPMLTPYQFASNCPISGIDKDGKEFYYTADGNLMGQIGTSTEIRVANENDIAKLKLWINVAKRTTNEKVTNYAANEANKFSTSIVDYAQDIEDVLNDPKPETYSVHEDCFKAATAQMAKAGVEIKGKKEAIQTDVDNNKQPSNEQLSQNTAGGAIYMMTQLKKGKPIMVGVKETLLDDTFANADNYNKNTGHFIVVTSMQKFNGNVTFGYYDNADFRYVKSNRNKLSLNTTTGVAIDNSQVGVTTAKSYKVSEVRKNK